MLFKLGTKRSLGYNRKPNNLPAQDANTFLLKLLFKYNTFPFFHALIMPLLKEFV